LRLLLRIVSHQDLRLLEVLVHSLHQLLQLRTLQQAVLLYTLASVTTYSKAYIMSKPTNKNKSSAKHHGIDALLMSHGKALAVGQEIRFALVKGPSGLETHDICNPKAPPEAFPVVAKFPESVVKPNFGKFKRFYQQDIPSQKVRSFLTILTSGETCTLPHHLTPLIRVTPFCIQP
jgi:hypothetical protein